MINSTQREEEFFAAALAVPPAERSAFLDRNLGAETDGGLRRRIEELLRAHDLAANLDEPAESVGEVAALARTGVDRLVGTRIGRFKLLEQIGEGGCGIVYMAEQEAPVRRRVALKVIKAGMDTSAVVARFEAERQALALMDHPNIARVFDGGATETGRPYFVMELVRGVPITRYCDEAKLSTADRLRLFLQVCEAVQHAHQKGVIHRDLKPSNIIVAREGSEAVPKVIDFGIAKAITGLRLTDKTLFTRFNDFIGTPVYMSPEQAEMTNVDVDTRSDIYSLGVLLYELLTAHLPFDRATLENAGVDGARRMLLEVDPPRPSQRVSALAVAERTTVAQRRSVEPTRLALLLRSDLDWIVLRCLEKDRARRYETVTGLAKDIERYLAEEPVLARPPSTGYRLQKMVRRHRFAVSAGAVVLLALALGLSLTTWQAIRATRAEREQSRLRVQAEREQELANAARAHAESLLGYLLDDFFDELHPVGRADMVGRFANRLISYYDKLPDELRNDDTERNRALAKLREGGALIRGKQLTEGAAMLQAGQDFFEQRHAARPDDETATLDLVTALGWQYAFGHLAANTQIPALRTLEQFRRAVDLVRPYATRPNASVRARRLYAIALSELGYIPGQEDEGIQRSLEARMIFRELGALELREVALATCYCVVIDTQARACLALGRLEEAEQLENECNDIVDRLLTKRPGDLEALSMRMGVLWTLSEIAERRFHLKQAAALAEESLRAANEYARFDREGVGAVVGPWFIRLRLSDLYWELGRVGESLRLSYEVIGQMDTFPRGKDTTIPERAFWQFQNDMSREWERGDVAAARRCVAGFMKQAETLRTLGCSWEPELTEYANTSARVIEYSYPQDSRRAFADALDDLKRVKALPSTMPEMAPYREGLRVRAICVIASAGVLAGCEAEAETVIDGEIPPLQDGDFTRDPWKLNVHRWLAFALARQKKATECSQELRPLLAFHRRVWNEGNRSMETTRGLGFILYIQALNEPDDAEGRARSRLALDEADGALETLSAEAKQLKFSQNLNKWIADERARRL